MKNLLYYPTFQPQDEIWLKFALIHIEDFAPILPRTDAVSYTENYQRILDQTELVNTTLGVPNGFYGEMATRDAINEINNVLRDPSYYERQFMLINPGRAWQQSHNWTFHIHEDKYSFQLVDFCLQNGFGVRGDHGLYIPDGIAQIFMTALVEQFVAHRRAIPITDNKIYYQMAQRFRANNPKYDQVISTAQAIILRHLPTSIEEISIDRLIGFRNAASTRDLRKAFNSTLSKFYESIENDKSPETYLEDLNKINKQYVTALATAFGALAAVSLGTCLAIKSGNGLELIAKGFEGLSLAINTTTSLHDSKLAGKERRFSRRFLSELRRI